MLSLLQMKQQSIDILIVIAMTLVGVITVVVTPDGASIRLLTLPLVLVLPGYALTIAIFPMQLPGLTERCVFSLGLSLIVVILGGLALNWTPFGLHTASWLFLLSSIILAACAVAYMRRRGQSIIAPRWLEIKTVHITFLQGLLLGLAVIVIGSAITVSYIGALQQTRPGFTQLWIMSASKTNPKTNPENAVRIGISNKESTVINYRLVVTMNGKPVRTWLSIRLNPNENWETILVLPQTAHSSTTKVAKKLSITTKVEAMLYRADAPGTVYRHVVLWLAT
jgi:uncharacterized membrane protein